MFPHFDELPRVFSMVPYQHEEGETVATLSPKLVMTLSNSESGYER